MRSLMIVLAASLCAPAAVRAQTDEARLLRFPTIHGDTIVFSYAGNLYTVPAQGGVAHKLTNHEGQEIFARFSPDGKTLAFTGQYDGNTEVYVMPAEGGVPKRLTFTATLGRDEVSDRMGPNNIVIGWKNNDEIIFRSRMREPNDFIGQLFTVPKTGGLPRQIEVPRGGFCSFSPDGKQMAYNRIFREFRTWKRYRGGMADEIWLYDFDKQALEQITDNPAGDIIPMWHKDKIYFLSDRDDNKRFNLFVHDLKTKKLQQLTTFKDWDIKYPSLGDQAIVFENAGYIHRFDLADGKAVQVPIRILEDFASSRTALRDVSKQVGAFEIAPDGQRRALFAARGDLFTVPAKEGQTRNLTTTPGVHDRNPKWSPDGKWIASISDTSGEDEIWLTPAKGDGPAQQLTKMGPPYKYALAWSPDSKKILWADKKLRLFFVNIDTKQVTQVAQGGMWEIRQYAWSPDSKWIAYARPEENSLQKIHLYSLEQAKSFEATDGWYEASHPEFSRDGKYLYFVSDRDFNPLYSEIEWNHAYADMGRIYLMTLAKDTPNPFRPKSDDEKKTEPADKDKKKDDKKEDKKDDKKEEKKDDKKEVSVQVDVNGLGKRVLQLPIPPAGYHSLTSVGGNIYYVRAPRKGPASFHLFDLAQKKEISLGTVNGYEISANGQKMLILKDGNYSIIDLPKGPITAGDPLNLGDLKVKLDLRAEWQQIFHESWRQMRDFFYDPNLHGVDWKALRARYEPLVAHVNHRADLSYVIGEMISELSASHAYVGGGDLPKPARIATGLLGAELEQDPQTKFFKIARILPGSNWDKNLRSPLDELGVNVEAGEYLVAIDGKPTSGMVNPFEALVGTVGKQVRLQVNKKPSQEGSREVVVIPIADEQPLYYYQWVQKNIETVSKATGGKIGYLHVPDMLQTGLNEFAKHFYPQLRKKGLIIDMRGNGGGNVSPMLIERLRREVAMIDIARNTMPRPDPYEMLLGPKVCLMNEFSASDGDLFPWRFRHYKLGKLIGKRSWGGTIGIRGSLPFLDGGSLNKPEFASYTIDGKKWVIEGHGVDPDIVVDNHPGREFAGTDEQLNRAIEVILEELRTQERTLPPPPGFPKR